MSILEKINQDFITAMKEREELRLSVLRLLKTAFKNQEIALGRALTQDEELSVVEKQAKQRRDSMVQYEKAGRQELVQKEQAELKILEGYLPGKLSEDEVRAEIQKIIASLNKDEKQNFGKVMGKVMQELKGRADAGMVSRIIKELL